MTIRPLHFQLIKCCYLLSTTQVVNISHVLSPSFYCLCLSRSILSKSSFTLIVMERKEAVIANILFSIPCPIICLHARPGSIGRRGGMGQQRPDISGRFYVVSPYFCFCFCLFLCDTDGLCLCSGCDFVW